MLAAAAVTGEAPEPTTRRPSGAGGASCQTTAHPAPWLYGTAVRPPTAPLHFNSLTDKITPPLLYMLLCINYLPAEKKQLFFFFLKRFKLNKSLNFHEWNTKNFAHSGINSQEDSASFLSTVLSTSFLSS